MCTAQSPGCGPTAPAPVVSWKINSSGEEPRRDTVKSGSLVPDLSAKVPRVTDFTLQLTFF
jgi:hypothetical protein